MSTARLQEMLVDAGLSPAERAGLTEVLAPLAAGADRVPEPSAELAALLGEPAEVGAVSRSLPATRAARRWRVRTASVGAVVLAVSSVGATGLSAAANSLPRVVQHHVSQFSRHYLPFDFPEPPKEGEPLGQGRMPRSPAVSLPPADDAYAGVTGAEPPPILPGEVHRSQAGPVFLTPAPGDANQQGHGSRGQQGYVVPSAAPSPTSSPSSAASPSPVAIASQSPSGDDEAGRPASASPSPTPSSGAARPDQGQAGGHKPGKGEDPSPSTRPGKSPSKSPAPGKGTGSGAGTGTDAGQGGLPVGGKGDGGADEPAVPTKPEPIIVVPELPGIGDLPDLPLAP